MLSGTGRAKGTGVKTVKILILIALNIGAFILIYKNLNKIKTMYEAAKEKMKTIIHAVKIKVMNVFLSIKSFFGRIFKRTGK